MNSKFAIFQKNLAKMSASGFDWKSESGNRFAKANPSNAEETDLHFKNHCGVTVTQCFQEICQILESKGNDAISNKPG